MKKSIQGISFIDLVLMMVIVGVIGAVAIPEYLDSSAQALVQAKWEKSGEVKKIHQVISQTESDHPSVKQLAAHVQGKGVWALENGISLRIDEKNYVIPTYRNETCTELTQSAQDPVACVGTIPS